MKYVGAACSKKKRRFIYCAIVANGVARARREVARCVFSEKIIKSHNIMKKNLVIFCDCL